MKRIPLTQNKFAIVDDDMFEYLNQWKWYARKGGNTFYAVRNVGKYLNQKKIHMHRQIMNAQEGQEIDHINHNALDNRRTNLRTCTRAQNQHNRKINRNSTSKFKGVYWNKVRRKWQARVSLNGKRPYLGSFNNELDAAKAYDKKAKELFGEFANLNFPK